MESSEMYGRTKYRFENHPTIWMAFLFFLPPHLPPLFLPSFLPFFERPYCKNNLMLWMK